MIFSLNQIFFPLQMVFLLQMDFFVSSSKAYTRAFGADDPYTQLGRKKRSKWIFQKDTMFVYTRYIRGWLHFHIRSEGTVMDIVCSSLPREKEQTEQVRF